MVRVKKAKLNMIPRVIPNGFLLPVLVEDARTMGKRGQMQGAKIVKNPERKAKNKRTNII